MFLAHAFGERYDLPIPLLLFVLGGSAVVVASFLLVLPRSVRGTEDPSLPDRPAPGALHPLLTPLSLAALAFVAYCGLAGSDEVAENLAPTVVWVLVWVAVPVLCGLLGDWTTRLNPFAALAHLVDRPKVRKAVLGRSAPLDWTFGWWPAVALFFGLACAELIYQLTTTQPHVIGEALVVYAVLNLFLGLLFGSAWVERGEVYSVLFSTWGRLGFWRFGAPGRRGFGGGLVGPFDGTASRLLFVLMMLISVNFDGMLSTPQWTDFERTQIGLDVGQQHLLRLSGFAVLTGLTLLVFGAFAVASSRLGRHATSRRNALNGLLPSLVPIAYGYLVAHNLAYLLVNGQLMAPLLGNPTGTHDLGLPSPFNDSYVVNATFLPSAFYWYVGVAVIVAVHVAAVVLAHRHLAGAATDEAVARRSELPWLVAMVGYTAFSLFLIAQPLVEEGVSSKAAAPAPAASLHA
jgi:hypothetical protein